MAWTLESEITLPQGPAEVFPFFADPANLDRITPDWLDFRLLEPLPPRMEEGARIQYRLRLRGVPIEWHSLIALWKPPHAFVDVQTKGPYRAWTHAHTFEATPEGGTRVRDFVVYDHLGGPVAERFVVRPDLERIFAYRRAALAQAFGATD